MKKALLVLIICIFLSGCEGAKGDGDVLSYQERAFEATVCVERDEMTFSAFVSASAWQKDGGEARNISVTYTAPATLDGIKVTREHEVITANVGGLPFDDKGDIYSSLIEFADLFCITSKPHSLTLEGENTRAEIRRDDGVLYSLLLSPKTDMPIQISAEKTTDAGKSVTCVIIESFVFTD